LIAIFVRIWSAITINSTDETAYNNINTKCFTIFMLKDLCVNSAYTSSCIDVTVTSPYVWVVFLFGQYCSHLSIYEQRMIVPCLRRMTKVMEYFHIPYLSCNQTTLDQSVKHTTYDPWIKVWPAQANIM